LFYYYGLLYGLFYNRKKIFWPRNVFATTGNYTLPNNGTVTDFHDYALDWKENEQAWYCDDRLVAKITEWHSEKSDYPAPFDTDFYLLLNLAVSGIIDEHRLPPASFTEAEMKIDYVREYKWDDHLTEPEIPGDKWE